MSQPFQPKTGLSPEVYQAAVDRLFLPDSVVATKANHTAPEWLHGSSRSLDHDSWQIQTADSTKVRTRDLPEIRFDANVSYGRLLLSDPSLEHDKLTKKILCVRALTSGVLRGPISSLPLYRTCLCFDWFVRWRIGKDIAYNRDFGPSDFEAFLADLSTDDVLSLVPIYGRLEQLGSDIWAGRFDFPCIRFGQHDLGIDWITLAEMLGVTRNSLSSSHSFRNALRDWIPRVAPANAMEIVNSLGTTSSQGSKSELSSRRFEDLLLPVAYLSRLSETGWLSHDPLRFNPFRETPMTVVARRIGKAAERTLTLHPEDFGNLLTAASTWIVSFADHVIDCVDAVRAAGEPTGHFYRRRSQLETLESSFEAKAPPGCPKIRASWTRGRDQASDDLSLNEAIRHLLAAAGIVIACLAARRRVEVESLKAGCVRETLPGVFTFCTYIAKNLRDVDQMPIPALVARAVGVLERLSAGTRERNGSDWLLRVEGWKGVAVPIEWSDALNSFAKLMKVPLPRNMSEWSLTFHQLRRGFAVFYYWGFTFSSLDALGHMLWHVDPNETRHYVFEAVRGEILKLRENLSSRRRKASASLTDREHNDIQEDRKRLEHLEYVGATWEEVRCEAFAHRLLQMWTGDEVAVGRGAKRLFAALGPLTRDLTEAVRVGPRSNDPAAETEEFLRRAMKWCAGNMLEPVPGVPVHCTCRHDHPDDLEVAACLIAKRETPTPFEIDVGEADRVPDTAYASTYVCLRCVHCAALSEDRTKIRTTIARLVAAVENSGSAAFKDDARASLDRLTSAVTAAEDEVAEFVPEKPSK